MIKLGFFGGCFNPPTIAHLEIALKAIEIEKLDKVYFVPMGDYYKKDCGFNLEKIEKGDLATPINFTPVDSAIYYLKKLNCETAVSEFEKWNETVKDTILNSSDFKQINQPDYEYYFYKFGLYSVVEKYAYHALDDKYKSASDRNVDDLIYAPVFFLKNMKYKWEEFSKVKECILP